MKKWLLAFGLLAVVFSYAEQKRWNPVQYYLEWDEFSSATNYTLYHAGQGMNDYYYTTNEAGEYTVPVAITNKEFSSWFGRDLLSDEKYTNRLNVLQGKSEAGVKYFMVASFDDGTYKTSNIIGWPTNWNTIPTNGFALRLTRTKVGPPMYINPNPPDAPRNFQ
ncbi:hypothetical protein E2P64_07755 [Candidatus Bathyarchaeota archaeon]|nr:hypothetical protein E2P64_07755 [Candidatus Bathyarchaeota archaeon]